MTENRYPPQIKGAAGLVWRRRVGEWVATWQARTDLVKRGFVPKTVPLWRGVEPGDLERAEIIDQCTRLQNEMITWGRGGLPDAPAQYTGTLQTLSDCYQDDPDSNFLKLEHKTRLYYKTLMKMVLADHGAVEIKTINGRLLKRWHEQWSARGVSMSHSMVGMLRTMFSFGAVMLEDRECERLCGVMHKMRFKVGKPRTETLTAQQADAIREIARQCGYRSIALAQAFQFDCMLRQRDVIGEWMPQAEPGLSDVLYEADKWMKGIRWEEIDDNMILRHVTSKRKKEVEINLALCPMVMDELNRMGERPANGPVIVCETTLLPWTANAFRRQWRKLAGHVGIPKTVRNMDSRAGAITEATEAGAPLEHIKQAATHGQIAMTERYARNQRGKTDNVLQMRAEHRNRK